MNLIFMKEFLDDLVETFRTVLDLECTIINANPIKRVSGTGIYKENPNENYWNASYAIKVIEEKRPIVIIDTTDRNWQKVGDKVNYYSIVLQPIFVDNIVEGVIVLASLNMTQQKMIIEKSTELLSYLEKIAQLISSKYKQEVLLQKFTTLNNQLTNIFETVTDGIILYSKADSIVQINSKAKKILNAKNMIVHEKLKEKVIEVAKDAIDKRENIDRHIQFKSQGKNYSLFVKTINADHEDLDNILIIVRDFKDVQRLVTSNDYEINDFASHNIIGESSQIKEIIDSIDRLKGNDSNILLTGESGTGKELFARTIHAKSSRKEFPFVAVNCAAIPDMLLESELFGYEEGSFTGAKKGGKLGKFLLANQGTIFLDEIGDMPLYLQAKLLRVLDQMKVDRIGSDKLIEIDVQILAATNKDLEEMVNKKEFREDLYYRLNVIPIHIPPLRERKSDIKLLLEYFINKYNDRFGKTITGVDKDVESLLHNYDWPGNVRELENYVQYMVSFEHSSVIGVDSIPHKLKNHYEFDLNDTKNIEILYSAEVEKGTLKELLAKREKEILNSFVANYNKPLKKNDVKEICKILDISVATFYRKYDLQSQK